MQSHVYNGYKHNEKDGELGAPTPSKKEQRMIDRLTKIWETDSVDKYMTRYGLSEAEARRLINQMKIGDYIRDVIRRLESAATTEEQKELVKELEGSAYKARIERLEQIQQQMDAIMQTIMQKHAQGAGNARRLVHTESHYLATQMHMASYEEAGIEKYHFTAVLDLKTSEICRELDGKTFAVKDKQVGVNCPPMHPWCRSTATAAFSPEIEARMKRSAIDPTTGKKILVPRSMTYKEWYKKFVEGKPQAETEEKKVKKTSKDRAKLKEYQEVLEDKAPNSLSEFQELKFNKPEKFEKFNLKFRDTKLLRQIKTEYNLKIHEGR